MPVLLNWSPHQKVLTAPNVRVRSSFIARRFVQWKGSDSAAHMVMEGEGLSFFLALKIIGLLVLLSLSSLIYQAGLFD